MLSQPGHLSLLVGRQLVVASPGIAPRHACFPRSWEAARLTLQVWPFAGLAKVQETAGSQAGGGRGLGKMREDCASSRLVSEAFDFMDRSNTGSAKNTPKSDIAMLARIQHLASLNWASHLIVDRRLRRPLGFSTVRPLILVGMRPSCCHLPCVRGSRSYPSCGVE